MVTELSMSNQEAWRLAITSLLCRNIPSLSSHKTISSHRNSAFLFPCWWSKTSLCWPTLADPDVPIHKHTTSCCLTPSHHRSSQSERADVTTFLQLSGKPRVRQFHRFLLPQMDKMLSNRSSTKYSLETCRKHARDVQLHTELLVLINW